MRLSLGKLLVNLLQKQGVECFIRLSLGKLLLVNLLQKQGGRVFYKA